MNSLRFIIGLRSNKPSTRILKPPGGDTSDLFGLVSRQKALVQSIKMSSLGALLRRNQDSPDKSRHLDSLSKDIIETPMESNSTSTQISITEAPKCLIPSAKANEVDEAIPKKTASKRTQQASSSTKNMTEETAADVLEKGIIGRIKEKDLTAKKCNSKVPLNSTKSTEKCQGEKLLSTNQNPVNVKNSKETVISQSQNPNAHLKLNSSKMLTDRNTSKRLIRNPITGTVTDINTGHKSDPISVNLAVKDKKTDFDSAGIRKPGNNLYPGANKAHVRRNPITGEGTLDDPFFFGTRHHNRLRIIHPPGGISSGIY